MQTRKTLPGTKLTIIISLLSLAGIFIFDHITNWAFWGDEADVANVTKTSFTRLWYRAVIGGHPLFYPYTLKVWSLGFGDSELSLRGFSALFALLLIILLYKTADKFLEDKKVGLIAAFLASTTYFLIWFATQNKVYTFASFLGLLSYYFFIKLASEPKKKDYFLYSLFSGLSAYTHPWLILVFLSQVLNSFMFGRDLKNLRKIIFAQLITLVLIVPSVLVTLYQGKLGAAAWITTVPLWSIFKSFQYLSFGSNWLYFSFFIIAAFYIFQVKNYLKEAFGEKELEILKMFLVYLFLPLFAALLVSQFRGVYVVGRYEMVILPAFLLIASIWFSKIKNNYLLFLMIALSVLFCFKEVSADREMVSNYQATDKTIAQYLLENIRNGDTIIATDLSYPTFSYYLEHLNEEREKQVALLIYPQELSGHPGWKDVKKMLSRKELYEKEAENLGEKLLKERGDETNTIWVLYNSMNPFNEILRKSFKKYFNSEEIQELPTPRAPSWIDSILKFK